MLGKAAETFRDALEELDAAQTDKAKAMLALVAELDESGKQFIRVGQYRFERKHTDARDGIKVQKLK